MNKCVSLSTGVSQAEVLEAKSKRVAAAREVIRWKDILKQVGRHGERERVKAAWTRYDAAVAAWEIADDALREAQRELQS